MKPNISFERLRQKLAQLKSNLNQGKGKDLTELQVLKVTRQRTWPTLRQWVEAPRVLSKGEKTAALIALILFAVSLVWLAGWFIITHRSEVPAVGGTYTEGLIGEPQFINPLYASASDVDADLTRLVYSGLFKYDSVSGFVPDLASSYEISEDQTVYTINIRDDAYWHDGEPVRASDVVFTIQSIQNPDYKSPLAVTFQGVSVVQAGDKTVQFILPEPFGPFLSTLTVGVIPSHVWEEIAPIRATLTEINLTPVGSGPYEFSKFTKDKKGNIRSYTLERNPEYYGGTSYLEELTFKFYSDNLTAVDALKNKNVEGLAFVPADLVAEVEKIRGVEILRPALPQVTAIFFNEERNELLADDDVRQALAQAIDKDRIVADVLDGFGQVIHGPILPDQLGYHENIAQQEYDPEAAMSLLEGQEELVFTMTVLDQAEFINAAEIIKEQWAAVGATLEIRVVPVMDLQAMVLSGHNYEMFLTGELSGIDPDPYPFWHSSQASDTGLNLSMYANRKADELLEEARTVTDPAERAAKYIEFQDMLAEDLPAIFLYQPTYRYAIASKIDNVSIDSITIPADRFSRIHEWYTKTKMRLQWAEEETEELENLGTEEQVEEQITEEELESVVYGPSQDEALDSESEE